MARKSFGDGAVLFVTLLGTNWWLNRSDPGWLGLNPTPWLALPVYLGARFGPKAGIVGAFLSGGAVLAWREKASRGEGFHDFLATHPSYFVALLVAGALSGAAQRMVAARAELLSLDSLGIREENEALAKSLRLLQRDKETLQNALLKHNASHSALVEELPRMLSSGSGRAGLEWLSVLRARFGVREAAIYRGEGGVDGKPQRWMLAAATGDTGAFEPALIPEEVAGVVKAALDFGEMVTCRHLWEEEDGRPDEVLAAFPVAVEHGEQGLLVVRRMDFERVTWENLADIEALWEWIFSQGGGLFWETGREEATESESEPGFLPERGFSQRVALARKLADRLSLPFRLVNFDAGDLDEERLEELASFLRGRLGRGEVLTRTPRQDDGNPVLMVLVMEADDASASARVAQWLGDWGREEVPFRVEAVRDKTSR